MTSMLPGKGKHGSVKKSGKGARELGKAVASTSKVKESPKSRREEDDKEGVVMALPLFKTSDNSRLLPRYTAILSRSIDEGLGMEDLDSLQLELEALLSCAAVRNRVLLEEIKILESAEEKRDRKSKLVSIGKRSVIRTEERPMKKLKESLKPDTPPPVKISTRVRGPGPSPGISSDPPKDGPKLDAPKVAVHKNDTPNKFWASVEPYCTNITEEDLRYLEELIQSREEEDSDLYKIPNLGKHYSLKWAEEDVASTEDMKHFKTQPAVGGVAGPLTQRLVSALIEDKVPLQEANDNKPGRELSSPRAVAVRNLQSASFEKRVRKELRQQGILDGDEAPKDQADDELFLEMKRIQSEMEAISKHNLTQLKHIKKLAVAQLERQDLKKKLKAIDAELLTIYNSKQKNKIYAKKERETAWRCIREREAILKQLYPSPTSTST